MDIGLVVHTRNARHLSSIPPGENERIYEVDMWFSFTGKGDKVAQCLVMLGKL